MDRLQGLFVSVDQDGEARRWHPHVRQIGRMHRALEAISQLRAARVLAVRFLRLIFTTHQEEVRVPPIQRRFACRKIRLTGLLIRLPRGRRIARAKALSVHTMKHAA